MKIALFSLNCASKKSIPLFEDRDVFDHDPEYFVEMTQEDYRNRNSPSLFASVPTNYRVLLLTDLNGKETKQNLQIRLYERKEEEESLPSFRNQIEEARAKSYRTPDVGVIKLFPKGNVGKTVKNKATIVGTRVASTVPKLPYGYTKGAVWIKIKEPYPVLLINMHLPMKKGSANLGLSLRVAALKKILAELKGQIDETTTVLIGGDLNFRIEPLANGQGKNQLTNLLASDPAFEGLQELPIQSEDAVFTCKFRKKASTYKKRFAKLLREKLDADPKENCTRKRSEIAVPMNRNLVPIAKTLQANCGASDRFPSRCDRFLVGQAKTVDVDVLQYKGYPFFPKSDHNAIYATVELHPSQLQRTTSMQNLVKTLAPIAIEEIHAGNIEEDDEEPDEEENNTSVRSGATSDPRSAVPSPISNVNFEVNNPMRFAPPGLKRKHSFNRAVFDPLTVQQVKNLNPRSRGY